MIMLFWWDIQGGCYYEEMLSRSEPRLSISIDEAYETHITDHKSMTWSRMTMLLVVLNKQWIMCIRVEIDMRVVKDEMNGDLFTFGKTFTHTPKTMNTKEIN